MENRQGVALTRTTVIAQSYIPLFWAGLLGIYMKAELANGYSRAVARLMSSAKDAGVDAPITEAFPFFANDVLLHMVAIPAIVIAVLYLLFRNRAPIAAAVVGLLLLTFYFIQLQAERAVGQYQSLQMMYEAARFAADESDVGAHYLSMSAIAKYLFMLAALVTTTLLASKMDRGRVLGFLGKATVGGIAAGAFGLTVLALVFYPAGSSGGLHQSAASKAFFMFAVSPDIVDAASRKSLAESFNGFRELTRTSPWRAEDDPLFGRETNANLVMFVLETGPASLLDHNDITPLLPAPIADHTLIARRHVTTYPYTSDAIFSILSGLYPEGRREVVARGGFTNSKVLFQLLSDASYDTAAYMPTIYNADNVMVGKLGMRRVFISNRAPESGVLAVATSNADALAGELAASGPHFDAEKIPELRRRLLNDMHALEAMKADMRTSLRENGKFAYLFMPQIGHAPWLPLGPDAELSSHGQALLKLQSRWLGEVVQILEDAGALNNTIVVLTADHGIRTTVEDPKFRRGTIDSYSFHVPFAMYAPRAFESTQATDVMTSHIDVEPSLASLMGVRETDGYSEGVPLWTARPDRRIYFFAEVYGGASGFYEKDYFMNNLITDKQFRNASMTFPPNALTPINGEARDYVKSGLSRFRTLHFNIVSAR